jgi:hypothetical protein
LSGPGRGRCSVAAALKRRYLPLAAFALLALLLAWA